MIRFYAPDIERNPVLPPDESAHVVRVLRRREGDDVDVVDGHGHLYHCRLAVADPRGAMLEVLDKEVILNSWNPHLTIAVAPTKNADRMEWLVEKLVELGVDAIVPLRCDRSERKDIKAERLERIAVSAMKQSLKATLPIIYPTTPLMSYVRAVAPGTQKLVGYCDADTERRLMATEYRAGNNLSVLIGPEGDFTPQEIEECRPEGYLPVTMGDNRLRTETAALDACCTFHVINQLNSI